MKLGWVVYSVGALIFAGIILFVSISRSNLDITIEANKTGKLHNTPVEFVVNDENGEIRYIRYKLPIVTTLPNNPLYFLRRTRDWLWLHFAGDAISKSKISLLLADKKIAEAKKMSTIDPEAVIGIGKEAVDKLKYSKILINELPETSLERKEVNRQIKEAVVVYVQILMPFDKSGELVNDLNNINEEIKKEEEAE